MDDSQFEGGLILSIGDDEIAEGAPDSAYAADTDQFLNEALRLRWLFAPVVFQKQQRQQQMQQMVAHLNGIWIPICSVGVPALAGLAGAWLQAKYGRRIRFSRGSITVEATSVEEIGRLLAMQSVLAAEEQIAIASNFKDMELLKHLREPEIEPAYVLQARIEGLHRDLERVRHLMETHRAFRSPGSPSDKSPSPD